MGRVLSLAFLALLLLAAFYWWLRPVDGEILVLSDPPGAAVFVELEDSGLRTPALLSYPLHEELSLQVRLPGHQSDPLIQRMTAGVLPDTAFFHLRPYVPLSAPDSVARPLTTPPAGLKAPASDATRPVPPSQVPDRMPPADGGESDVDPETASSNDSRQQPSAAQARPEERGLPFLVLEHWDPRFRLSRNSLPLAVDEEGRARPGQPGPGYFRVHLGGAVLLDTVLTLRAGGETHRLLLPGPERLLEVRVEPPEGQLLFEGLAAARGSQLLPRSLLPRRLRFGKLAGWLVPADTLVSAEQPTPLVIRYLPEQSFVWPEEEGRAVLRLVAAGARIPKEGLREFELPGEAPLRLGRGRNDRRPWGVSEFVFECVLPAETHPDLPAWLSLRARDTGDNFPMSFRDRAQLYVDCNGVALSRELLLEEEAGERRWPVGRSLRPGSNRITVRAVESNTSWAELQGLKLELAP